MLPCDEQVEATHSATTEDKTPAIRGAKVLVVEDEDILRLAVSKALRKNAFSVLEASDGNIALDLIRAQKDDIGVLFLDITLPGASGREVYEEAERLIPGLPVIVTSAKSKEIAAAALSTGIERFLRKPFGLDSLIEMIRQVLPS